MTEIGSAEPEGGVTAATVTVAGSRQALAAGRPHRRRPSRVAALGIQLDNVVTSQRVGNFLHQPGYGLLVDQSWVDSTTP
jgi:hypothetical protein